MTDEELSVSDATLIARLRDGCSCNIDSTPCMAEEECRDAFAAADRIEALVKDRDAGAKDYCALMDRHDALFVRAEQLAATNEALVKDRDALISDHAMIMMDRDDAKFEIAVIRARAERLEAALREILEKPRNADLTYAELFAEVVSEARAALKGDDHE